MKLYFEEGISEYKSYSFPYKVYALREKSDSIDSMYNSGFLHTRIMKDLYYLSRSLRVNLEGFGFNSENRRVIRKVEQLNVRVEKLSDFDYDFSIGKLAKDFYDSRFSPKTFSAQKMKWVFTSGALSHVFIYSINGETIGYCPAIITENIIHYSYPFYSLELENKNIGMGMMLGALDWCIENGRKYTYLGTIETKASLYKLQFNNVEYFDGQTWSSDMDRLKATVKEGGVLENTVRFERNNLKAQNNEK